ncbi:TIGR02206 family membrane protein [Lagierella sp.]|uniref:TMEM164-related integral membrane acyltransferase n=1 Tax=Lagierella sp. TaxID=2849657 RepID=UPI00260A0B7C|nr:TIGR02206 family membrane protein [Lagierella sp.]
MTEFIKPFGLDHFIYMTIFLLFAIILFKKKDAIAKNQSTITKVILVTSIIQQIVLYGSYLFLEDFNPAVSLPLHISRINTIMGILYLITRDRDIYKIISFTGFFALLSFLYPSQVHKISHPIGISFLVNHIITLLMPFYIRICFEEELPWEGKNFAFGFFLTYLMAVYTLNPLIDGNYFYLVNRPITLLNEIPDLGYLILCSIFAYVMFSLVELLYRHLENKPLFEKFNIKKLTNSISPEIEM